MVENSAYDGYAVGLLFVLIFYVVAFAIAASIGAVALGLLSAYLTRRAENKRKRAILASITFPFACVVYAGCWFVAYAVINSVAFHRDIGLGDSWETPLPNGYALNMIDTTDEGTVYDPRTQQFEGSIGSQSDTVFGVRKLQVAGSLIFGANDTGYFGRVGQDSTFVDNYFELNTNTAVRTNFKSLPELEKRAAGEGVSLRLRPFEAVFSNYRYTWFDYLSWALLLLVPAAGFAWLASWVWKIRKANPHGVQAA